MSVLYVYVLIKCVLTGVQQKIGDVENQIEGMWLASLELNNVIKCVYSQLLRRKYRMWKIGGRKLK